MIPTIGWMIGAYIFTRMVELVLRPDRGVIVKVLAVMTAIFTLLAMFALWWDAPSAASFSSMP